MKITAEMKNIIADMKKRGYSAIEIHKYLREKGFGVPWILTRDNYNKS